jgi:hypothetical protein
MEGFGTVNFELPKAKWMVRVNNAILLRQVLSGDCKHVTSDHLNLPLMTTTFPPKIALRVFKCSGKFRRVVCKVCYRFKERHVSVP